jgi:tetratricopeptide (TPR) repeat protein
MRAFLCAFGLGLLVAVSSSTASAQQAAAAPASPGAGQPYPTCSRPVTPDEVESAHQKYIAGKVDYDEARYDSAILRFRDAYARDCTKHDLLVIISRAYEQRGDRAEAVRALEEYLKRVPNTPERSTYEIRIQTLKEAIDKENKQKAAAAAAAANNSGTNGAGAGNAGSGAPPAAEKEGGHTPYPWILVGVGGAAIVVGGILLVVAPKLPPNCDDATNICTSNAVDPSSPAAKAALKNDQDNAGKHVGLTTGGLVAIIGGVGLLGAGLVWHFVEPTGSSSSASRTPHLTPAVAPGYAGLSLGASF